MRQILSVLLLFLGLVIAPGVVSAQITIEQNTNADTRDIPTQTDPRFATPEIGGMQYTTDAIRLAERRQMRHERNNFRLELGLKATQTYFNNWAKGGNNTFNGVGTINLQHQYKKARLSFTTKLDARYGMSVIDTTVWKNEDLFNINFLAAWDISRRWSYSGGINLRSQFAKGYNPKKKEELVSSFMSPGVFDIAFGFTYDKNPWKITISPITGSMLFVLSDSLSRKGINGIDPGKHFKPMVGPSLNIDFDQKFARDALRYKSNFYTFYNFRLDPMARWENTLTLQATKWLATSIYWYMIYDKEAATPYSKSHLQVNYSIGVGLSFTYKNK